MEYEEDDHDDDDDDMPPACDSRNISYEVINVLDSVKDVPDEKPTQEEKKSLWKRFIEWLKQLPETIMSKLMGLELDLDGNLTVDHLISLRKLYNWYDRSGAGQVVKCPTELCPGDRIAVKMKSSRIWWNHMIVTDVYQDGIDVVSPCTPSLDPDKIKLECDFFNLKDIGIYFGTSCSKKHMEISEFPLSWSSVRKAVRFDHDVNGKYTREQIVERARLQIGRPEMWDLSSKNSEQFVTEILTGNNNDVPSEQNQMWKGGIAAAGEGINATSFCLAKRIHLVFKGAVKIIKSIVRLVLSGEGADIISALSKAVKILGYIGLCIGPIVCIISCAWSIYLKRKRYQNGEIKKDDYHKFITVKVAELLTDILFALLSGACFLFIPIPVVNMIVSFFLGVIGFLINKAIGFAIGSAWDYFHKEKIGKKS